MTDPRIVIAGAGNIGCYLGGLLAAAGRRVTLLGRERIGDALAEHGLHLTDLDGLDLGLGPGVVPFATDPVVLADADLILVTVKSGATAEMAALIAAHAPPHATVISLQNGIANADILRAALRGRTVLAGMVPFNVGNLGDGHFHRGTSGSLVIEDRDPAALAALTVPHLGVRAVPDIGPVQWGKLVINLNNALNALSGLTVFEQLQSRPWRRVMAAQQAEALALLAQAGIDPVGIGKFPLKRFPAVLRLPTPLFRLLAKSSVRVDRRARSSMWDDLERRRPTEVGELQGAVIALAQRLGATAPIAVRVTALIRAAEAAGQGSPGLAPAEVLPKR
ncbi:MULTISPECIES: 2-dehydropantoate 2-reductase [Sphingomonas]|uniref:2-dehydropantoate 2-reductase n=1 Tax=Sphingomonas TaxID=13687 RepID=UPI000DEFA279|nr:MULTISPECIES: 2-dehydropantoate 2-reductase [Sphingomonas]